MKRLLEKRHPATGLRVSVEVHQTGRKYVSGLEKDMEVLFDDFHPRWNGRAVPSAP